MFFFPSFPRFFAQQGQENEKLKLIPAFLTLVENRMRNPSLRLNLKTMLDKKVTVKIRLYRTFLRGTLASFDQYSNILLENAVEYGQDEETGQLVEKAKYSGPILLRGDSIIALSSVK